MGFNEREATGGSSISLSKIAEVLEFIDKAGETGLEREWWPVIGTPVDPARTLRGVGANNGGLDALGDMTFPVASEEGARWAVGRTGEEPLEGCGECSL